MMAIPLRFQLLLLLLISLFISSSSSPLSSSSSSSAMLNDVIIRLHSTGHVVVSQALLENYAELSQLNSFTLFALNDTAIFSRDGNADYITNFKCHVVPNIVLTSADLLTFPPNTSIPTMDYTENYTLELTSDVGEPSDLVEINHVLINQPDLLDNDMIAIHGISSPFPRFSHDHSPPLDHFKCYPIRRSNHYNDIPKAGKELQEVNVVSLVLLFTLLIILFWDQPWISGRPYGLWLLMLATLTVVHKFALVYRISVGAATDAVKDEDATVNVVVIVVSVWFGVAGMLRVVEGTALLVDVLLDVVCAALVNGWVRFRMMLAARNIA